MSVEQDPAADPAIGEGETIVPRSRPLAHEDGHFLWNMRRIPPTLPDGTLHPARINGIFVVHGIGEQLWTATVAELRSGFEDAFEAIRDWQQRNPSDAPAPAAGTDLPPPFLWEGYWGNYEDLAATFPDDWASFNEREQRFFGGIWKSRVFSNVRTIGWFLARQLCLLSPRVLKEVGPMAWVLYLPLQVISTFTLIFALLRHPRLVSGYLNDVRLYADPRGVTERAIVQRIDQRVRDDFLRMLGLDRDFRPLHPINWIEAGGTRMRFERVLWVAHSLGTVISYNVLSSLFHQAREIKESGSEEQKAGVERFENSLRRFVTLGSPLDKIAFLFKDEGTLRPWPRGNRRAFLDGGESAYPGQPPEEREWWINFYHVFDPVSGTLESPLICGGQPPCNLHIRSGWIPGWAHVAYWSDRSTLRFILGRTYGHAHLRDRPYRPWPPGMTVAAALFGYFVWAALLVGGVWLLVTEGPELLKSLLQGAVDWLES